MGGFTCGGQQTNYAGHEEAAGAGRMDSLSQLENEAAAVEVVAALELT